jgi:3-isopropylmalate/(R)-2-methylmalate dehydratase small subunit
MPKESVISSVIGRGLPLPGNDIDTDRIIPARFMKCVTFDGLGEYAFYDVRHDTSGKPIDHPMNDPRYEGASILLVGRNFGCGSSREHAPQALARAGITALIGGSFADIFAGNCAQVGLVAVEAEEVDVERLADLCRERPSAEIVIDLETMKAGADGYSFPVKMPESRRRNFLAGEWDSAATLLANEADARVIAARLPYLAAF